MAAPWQLHEARLVQIRSITSGAGDVLISFANSPVPAGKVWCVIGVGYKPSVAETKVIAFERITASAYGVALLNPISLPLNPATATCIEQGMEFFLLPSEYILARRDSATAGSTMSLTMEFVEIDLPLYTYDEPQIVKRQDRALSSIRNRLGGGSSVVQSGADRGERGGRTGPLPK